MAKKYKPKKPNPKIRVKKIQDTEGLNTGFGTYREDTGGGHPFEAGNSNTRTTKENGQIRQAENPTTKQPRTEDGKFTYKSVNGQSIDPKYGPSRGTTVPPTLTGGVNGIEIDDVESQFTAKKGEYWDKWKGKWWKKGGEVVTAGLSTKISLKEVWNAAKEYDKELGEFRFYNDKGELVTEKDLWKGKKGAKGKEETSATDVAEATGEQQNVVVEETGEIKTVGDKFKEFIKEKEEEPVKETEGGTETEKETETEVDKPWGKTGKFTERHKNNFIAKMKDEIGDEFNEAEISDDDIEEFLGQLSEEELKEIYDYKK